MSPAKATPDDAEESLKRLGGGRWQTRDERFTIEPQSGTWAVVDAEATDDLGLPLVRGPFRSLTDAKAAIATARTSEPAASPLAERLERGRATPQAAPESKAKPARPSPARRAAGSEDEQAAASPPSKRSSAPSVPAEAAVEPAEPGWMRDLEPADRGRARRLIERLTTDGVADAESIVRRDLAGGVPALAAHAIAARLAELSDGATPSDVVELLAEGRDERLGVRWRIVDGDGRPILIDTPKRGRRRA